MDAGGYDWALWLGLAVVLVVVEMTTLGLMFAMLAVGALAGAGTALLTDNLALQGLVALAVSVAMIGVVRPVAIRHLRTPLAIRTGTAALVGERALVLEPVSADAGRVKLRGEVWSARSFDPHTSIEAGRSVEIVQIDGATVVVYESGS